jgi:hypothetical protein
MKYYEIHKKTVYTVLADSQQDALDAVWNGEASIEEEEYLVDKTSEEVKV